MLSAASRACNSWRIFSTLSETHSIGEVRSNRAEELEKRLNDLTSELEKERKERMDLRDKLGELTTKFTKHKLAQYKAAQYDQQRLRQLQQSPETPQKLQQPEKIKPVARSIDELTSKLAAYTTVQHRQKLRSLQQTPERIESSVVSLTPSIDRKEETVLAEVPTAPEIQLQPPEKIESAADSQHTPEKLQPGPAAQASVMQQPHPESTALLHHIHMSSGSNLLLLYHSDTPKSISYELARNQIKSYIERDKVSIHHHLTEFFSEEHAHKARTSGGHVSMGAVKHWIDWLVTRQELRAKLHEFCHPTNIFQLCRTDAPESIRFSSARDIIMSAFSKCNNAAWVKYRRTSKQEILGCDVCKVSLTMPHMIRHFFSLEHSMRAWMIQSNVSLAAVNHWLDVLQKVDADSCAALSEHPQQLPEPAAEVPQMLENTAMLHETCHPTNIFQLCRSNTPGSIPFESALNMFHHMFIKYGYAVLASCCFSSQHKELNCEVCNKTYHISKILVHFLSDMHCINVPAGSGVSLAAVQYWLRKLEKAESLEKLHDSCHPINIFQLCRPNTPDSITYENARRLVTSAYEKCDKEALSNHRSTSYPGELECEVCEKTFQMPAAIAHLYSKSHKKKAHGRNANVSLAAVNYWLDVLQKVAAASSDAQSEQPQQLPEPAAEAPQMQQPPVETEQSQPDNTPMLHEICHPTNVLQLYHSDTAKTIPFESARDLLQPFFAKCYEGEFARYCHATEKMIFSCKLCEKDVSKYQTPFHFLTKEHIDKARANGGNVSLAAVKYWLFEILQVYSTARPELQQQSATRKDLVQSDPSVAARMPKELVKEKAN